MGKLKKSKELLELFVYEKIKGDVSYSSLMKKTGGNGKGYLDRYFVLHRNYVLYYKPGKTNFKPDDKQEPQGYINLRECKYDETKEMSQLVFQICHQSRDNGNTVIRNYLIKSKDESSMKQFLTLLKARIKSLSTIDMDKLGGKGVVNSKIEDIKSVLTNPLILPDRVSTEMAVAWVSKMKEYYLKFYMADPFIKQVEQISEYCRDEVKNYIDWFSGPEGPRLAMIRCEETVITNWVEYINKTKTELTNYEKTRFYREDFEDIKTHLKNMTIFIDCYNDYMRHCRKHNNNNNTPKEKFLPEKQQFKEYIDKYSKVNSQNEYTLDQFYDYPSFKGDNVTVTAIGKRIIDSNNPSGIVGGNNSSTSSLLSTNTTSMSTLSMNDCVVVVGSDGGDNDQPTQTPSFSITVSDYPSYKSDFDLSMELSPPLTSSTPPSPPSPSSNLTLKEEVAIQINDSWTFSSSTSAIIYNIPTEDGRNESKTFNVRGYDLIQWNYVCGYFKSKNMGSILWNGKTWLWSHPRTSYKIRFDWNPTTQRFSFIEKPRDIGSSSSSSSSSTTSSSTSSSTTSLQASTSSISSLSGSGVKRGSNHPTTQYADWQIKDNILSHIPTQDKHTPILTLIESPNDLRVPNACLLVVAMTPYILDALIHIGISPNVLTNK